MEPERGVDRASTEEQPAQRQGHRDSRAKGDQCLTTALREVDRIDCQDVREREDQAALHDRPCHAIGARPGRRRESPEEDFLPDWRDDRRRDQVEKQIDSVRGRRQWRLRAGPEERDEQRRDEDGREKHRERQDGAPGDVQRNLPGPVDRRRSAVLADELL